MKLSDNTIEVLKNFSTIGSLLIKPGNVQAVIEKHQGIYAEATLSENFPVQFGIGQLGAFMNNIGLFKEANVEFGENNIAVIGDDTFNVAYRGTSPKVMITPPDNIKEVLNVDNPDASFTLSKDSLDKIIRVATMNSLPEVSIVSKDGKLFLKAFNKKDDTSSSANIKLDESSSTDFEAVFLTEHLNKVLKQDYSVKVNLQGYAKFENTAGTLAYYVTMQV